MVTVEDFDVDQFVIIRGLFVFFPSHMWHVAPIIGTILHSAGQLRCTKDESIGACAIDYLVQIVDPTLLGCVPVQVDRTRVFR